MFNQYSSYKQDAALTSLCDVNKNEVMLLFSTSTIIVDRYHIRKPLSAGSWHDLFCCRLLCVTRLITMLKIIYIGFLLSTALFIKFVFSVSGYVQDLLLYVESQLHRINPDSDGHCD